MNLVNIATLPTAVENAKTPATDFIRALRQLPSLSGDDRLKLLRTLNKGQDEVDALRTQGELGVTVQLNEVVVKDAHEGFFGGAGEIYTVSWLLDGSGKTAEFKSKVFTGINDGDRLPLGGGGMLLGYIKNPRWFIDMHAVVMESDSDIRGVGDAIAKAKQESGWDELVKQLGVIGALDPTKISQAINVVGLLADLVSFFLKQNGDDHVATIHDFYLEQQVFGAGRHPEPTIVPPPHRTTFQDVETSYTITLSTV
ncbi:MAG: hypothetical protein A3F84_23845 [Candidatus Handelsmanbacteria bacterium RIFCSPLOWO2_12_FULL_64_10]|uniref:Uncharacterized protein n=1 Tax=Handelsmanbacteria sp. (strain RIFCSPLOWO2_12_FULL_64_10) TaxID=1817868 RepID=A0A1F6D2J7_HANXR|nr:MAG: hypothetical protein A3F84_23845 [Candidatus Handelsmanbacteria bacterium RIFCSPLOWO2_12_FULL_64_10]